MPNTAPVVVPDKAIYVNRVRLVINFFFFFQAEDGIRDADVTGVQTCALPISPHPGTRPDVPDAGCRRAGGRRRDRDPRRARRPRWRRTAFGVALGHLRGLGRSEERRVGKECRSRWSPYH